MTRWEIKVLWWRLCGKLGDLRYNIKKCLRGPAVKTKGPNPLVAAEFIGQLDKALEKQPHIGPLLARLNASGQVEFIDKEESEDQNGEADKGRDQHKVPPPPAEG